MLRLRPHHLLCIYFYQGKGYNEAFVDNMDKIIMCLQKDPHTAIQLACGKDMLCAQCPHCQNSQLCMQEAKVKLLDSKVVSQFKLNLQQVYPYYELVEKVHQKLTPQIFYTICRSCEWYHKGVCTEAFVASRQNAYKTNNHLE